MNRARNKAATGVGQPVEVPPLPATRCSNEVDTKPKAIPSVMLVVSGIMKMVRNEGIAWSGSPQRILPTEAVMKTPTRTRAGASVG